MEVEKKSGVEEMKTPTDLKEIQAVFVSKVFCWKISFLDLEIFKATTALEENIHIFCNTKCKETLQELTVMLLKPTKLGYLKIEKNYKLTSDVSLTGTGKRKTEVCGTSYRKCYQYVNQSSKKLLNNSIRPFRCGAI